MPFKDPEMAKQNARSRYLRDRDQRRIANRAWAQAHKERIVEITSAWSRRNRDKVNANKRQRRAEDPSFRMRERLCHRLWWALKKQGLKKTGSVVDLFGCTVDFLRGYIEAQFTDGMNWDTIQIDHIRPCASFDLSDDDQQRACFHYSNLRPMLAKDNLAKGSLWNGCRVLNKRSK